MTTYEFAKVRADSCFANGKLDIERSKYTECYRFIKQGKEGWTAEVDTVHGDYGMFLEHEFFDLAAGYILVASWYEHSRGGHSNAGIAVCDSRQLLFSGYEDIRTPFLFSQRKGRLQSVLFLRDLGSTLLPENKSKYCLGHELVEYEVTTGKVLRRAEVWAARSKLTTKMGLWPEDFENRERAFSVSFDEDKSGDVYLKVSLPAAKSAGTFGLALEASFANGS